MDWYGLRSISCTEQSHLSGSSSQHVRLCSAPWLRISWREPAWCLAYTRAMPWRKASDFSRCLSHTFCHCFYWCSAILELYTHFEPRLLCCHNLISTEATYCIRPSSLNEGLLFQMIWFFIWFLADRTATQYDRLLVSSCRLSVCMSVCLWRCALWLSVYRAKVVPACSSQACCYLSLQILVLLLLDVLFSHKMHYKKRVEETRVCISIYGLLIVDPRDLISSSR